MALHVVLGAGVIFVPTFRDALNLAALAGKSGYVDKAYSRTVFGENVQMIQVEPKFQYPPGYFAPESVLAAALAAASPSPSPTPDPNAPKIISQATPFKPEIRPSPFASPSPISSPAPAIAKATASPAAKSGTTKDGKIGNPKADEQKGTEKDRPDAAGNAKQQEAQKQLDAVAAANHFDLPAENEINRKPLKDLVAETNDLKNQGKLDLDHEFDLRIDADLDEKGQLQNPTVTRKSGDQTLVALSTRAIGVLNETGLVVYLKYLSEGKPIKVTFVVTQDQTNLNATVESEVNTEEIAKQKVKTMNLALSFGQIARDGKDEAILMHSTSVSAEGKKVIVKFKMAHQDVAELLKKQLASSEAAKPD
jgi:hypothetical protein